MNQQLAEVLDYSLEKYNELQEERYHLDWWEVLGEISDVEDDKAVAAMIMNINTQIIFLALNQK